MTVTHNGAERADEKAQESTSLPDYLDVPGSLGMLIHDEVKELVDHVATVPTWLDEFFQSVMQLDEGVSASRAECLIPQYSQITDVEEIGTMVLRLGRHLRTYADLHRFSPARSSSSAEGTGRVRGSRAAAGDDSPRSADRSRGTRTGGTSQ